jgi:hypothetical protein
MYPNISVRTRVLIKLIATRAVRERPSDLARPSPTSAPRTVAEMVQGSRMNADWTKKQSKAIKANPNSMTRHITHLYLSLLVEASPRGRVQRFTEKNGWKLLLRQ